MNRMRLVLTSTLILLTPEQEHFIQQMSHLVVDQKDLKSKKEVDLTDSELESEDMKQQA